MCDSRQFEPWRIGLCGCGSSLSMYDGIQLPRQGFNLVAVADPRPERRQLAIDKWGVSGAYSNPEEMFEKEKPHLVLIATPPSSHFDLIMKAAKFGAHILVQKPLARTLREAKQIIETCHKLKVGLRVSFYRRYTPAFLAAHQLAASLGQGLALRVNWCSSSGLNARADKLWKERVDTLGGVLVDLGSHVIDVARWWMGESLNGHLAISIVRGDLDNIASFLLLHASGASTLCYLSNVERDKIEVYEYVAKYGGFTLLRSDEGYPGAWTLRSWRVGELNQNVTNFEPPVRNPFITEMTDFLSAIKRDELSVDLGNLGTDALRVTTGLYRSLNNRCDCDLDELDLYDLFQTKKKPIPSG
jgi:predicted dehydrogenase